MRKAHYSLDRFSPITNNRTAVEGHRCRSGDSGRNTRKTTRHLGNLVKVGDDEDLDLSPTKSKQAYQLSKTKQKFVLCVTTRSNSVDAVGIAPFGVTKDPDDTPIPDNNGTCGHGPIDPERYVLYTRSVEAIFFYLGERARVTAAAYWILYLQSSGGKCQIPYELSGADLLCERSIQDGPNDARVGNFERAHESEQGRRRNPLDQDRRDQPIAQRGWALYQLVQSNAAPETKSSTMTAR